jgi:hypothetical protein
MKVPAKPALNKDGFARITFKGHSEHEQEKTSSRTGEVYVSTYTKLAFEIMDTTRTKPIRANIILGSLNDYAREVLGKLGYQMLTANVEFDSDGFEIVLGELDEDGFEKASETSEIADIDNFLNALKDTSFLAKLARDEKGYYRIDHTTIK